ncbi:type I polyketide synthase [Kitasatospora acidiphila]|uniref:type I polyketide synthase n=1 Tax=Kitasatospora acidiphila TaxID=2567942 RepID=UPI003C764B50
MNGSAWGIPGDAIAIIGMSCRLPQAPDPDSFWELLRAGGSAISEIPEGRWEDDALTAATAAPSLRRGGFLDGVDRFDAEFFGISPREAAGMDPQQRLVLELGWEALEHAGVLPARARGSRAGVFVGAIWDDYATLLHRRGTGGIGHHTATGLQRGIIANRLSHVLGLRGPSLTVDCGQSSSLVAVHLACESLRSGECEIALAGGVNLNLAARSALVAAGLGALSPDGRCYTFDERANGYVRGEGGGLVVLKPLARAIADSDPIHAVVRGSAVNNDGGGIAPADPVALTVPDAAAQREVLRLACERAGVEPDEIQYVELHGTGTRVGDPVEAAALGALLGAARPTGSPLAVGSVKTNIGHLEGAAGIAGLLKAVLALRHRRLPASLNFEQPNPAIPLDRLNLRVQRELGAWPAPERQLTAGVSSFGMGGTNCHVVLSAWEQVAEDEGARSGHGPAAMVPWVLSGRSAGALRAQAAALAAVGAVDPVDVGFSLATTRTAFEHRAVVVAADRVAALGALAAGEPAAGVVEGVARGDLGRVAFVFPGQGAQWAGMAVELLDTAPVFAERMGECAAALAPFVDWDLFEVLRGDGAELDRVDVVQPVLFAVMVSLAELWRSYGVEPSAVVGHSQGEIAAACVAGALSLADAARVVALRSRALQAIAGRGGMVSVALSLADVRGLLTDGLSVAAVNGPEAVVVSGDNAALDALLARCEADGVRARRIPVDYASHSAHVEELESELLEVLAPIVPRSSSVPFYSTVTGGLLDTAGLDAGYWYRNLRQTVELEATVGTLTRDGHSVLVEVSPHPVLTGALRETAPQAVVAGTLRRGEGGPARFLTSLAELYVQGVPVSWAFPESARRIELPTYAFQRTRHWLDGLQAPQLPTDRSVLPSPKSDPADLAGQADPAPAAAAERSLLDLVRAHAAAVLGHADRRAIAPQRTFKELGFDSVTAVELRDRLNRATGLSLPSALLFNHPTPARLAEHLRALADGTAGEVSTAPARVVTDEDDPVVIVGMGCRLPGGADSPEALWDLVLAGRDAVTGFPEDRGWDLAGLYDPSGDRPGTSYAREGGFLAGAAEFDAGFFGISPREALAMDPQQRLLLETSWEALERAGLDPTAVRGEAVGVFVGMMAQDYGPRLHEAVEGLEGHRLTGGAASVASGRIAYTLGLEGPAVTVDTACSSSLVALHLAARSLRAGECRLALAGGVTVMATPGMFTEFSRQRGLAADGRCKPFAAAADGTGWAEGAGVLVLERLSNARRRGHQVLAVVRGSAVNQDGASNGLSAPNGPSQERVIRAALLDAGLTVDQVDAVEAHGTGTMLGDPIEAQALLATYGQRDAEQPLWLGSLKSNIGHAQAAAGVAGVMKMVLAMRHELLPRTLHVDEPTSHVDWSTGAVSLLTEEVAWPRTGGPRRAGVSSFGISGTNAHVILESPAVADVADAAPDGAESVPWLLSACSGDALRAQAERLRAHLADREELSPAEVGLTLATGRAALEHRAVVLAADRASALRALAEGELATGVVQGVAAAEDRARVVFVFPGQGSQWVGMAVELLDVSPVFAERMGECAAALRPFVDWDLAEVLRGDGAALDRVDVVQPVLFAVMVSLAELWRSYGVEPSAVVGHSQGEIAAACVAGALSLADAARVVALRSRAIHAIAGRGGMVSVSLSLSDVRGLLTDGLSVAAVNGPVSVVVSGDTGELDALLARCEANGVRGRRIPVDYASHSAHVEELEAELLEVLAPIVPRSSTVPFYSTVTGGLLDTACLDASYWYRNLRQTVELEATAGSLTADGHSVFVEVSPHPVLTMALQETAPGAVVTGTLRRNDGGLARFLASAAELHVNGTPVTWQFPSGTRQVDLPTYAFQRQRYWLDTPAPIAAPSGGDAGFWEAVEQEDLDALARTVGSEPQELTAALPALAAFQRRRRQSTLTDAWRYDIAWRPLPEPAQPATPGAWLLVVPAALADDELSGTLRSALRCRLLLVPAGEVDGEELAEQLRQALAAMPDVVGVLSLLALDETPHPSHPALSSGLAASLDLIRVTAALDAGVPLWCATRGAVSVGRSDRLVSPAQAQLWGLGRVAALEYPQLWGGLVDLPGSLDARAATRLARVIGAGVGGEDQLALRASGVFARRLVHAPLGGRPARRAWRPRGTALITGGTGVLGAHVARWLARGGAERLVLVSRQGPAAAGAAELVAELGDLGVRAVAVACDLADPGQAAELVRRVTAEHGPIRSVVHAAGVGRLAPLAETDPAALAEAVGGKVAGLRHLDALLDCDSLDAVVLFSSIAGVWGVGEHAAYAAANAHLDAFAQLRAAEGLPVLSVAWGPWAGGGMIPEALQDTLRRRGVPVIDPERAIGALQTALDHADRFVLVAEVDWDRFVPVFTGARPSPLLAELSEAQRESEESTAGEPGLRGRLAGLAPAERERTVLELVRTQVAAVLGHGSPAAVEVGRAFKELGFDSLTSVDLRNRLAAATGLALPVAVVFDQPSAVQLARYLLGRLTEAAPAVATTMQPVAAATEPIAIVGLGCRLPGGVRTPEQLWELVRSETDAVSGFPTDRGWDLATLFDDDPDRVGHSYARAGGFLHDAAAFDAGFFGISPREALAMDPQQRLLLETSWEALERAGVEPRALRGSRTGVFVGASAQEYGARVHQAEQGLEGYLITGAAGSVTSGRIAYALGLEGAAVTVDTACSSSLVALHLAVQSLRQGECTLALAAGTTVMADPEAFRAFSRQRALSPDGRCKAFAAAADGFGLAEGVGVLVLERLSDAERHGHPVLAVVRGTAVNQDGASNGLTAPNGPSQQRVIRAALADAGLTADQVDAVEAHGTGTTLGDPIEAQAILATYGQDRQVPLRLGSLKSNIGHTQATSGVAGVIKMVLAMRHGMLPRTLHVDEPTPHVDWSAGAVQLLAEAQAWPRAEEPRRAGVSSFGISGTNAHVILEEAPVSEPSADAGPVLPLVPLAFSARSPQALRAQADGLGELLDSDLSLADVGFSLAAGRSVFEQRSVVVGSSREELLGGLSAAAAGRADVCLRVGEAAQDGLTAFLFTGQGAQRPGMGRELYEAFPVFAEAFDAVCARVDAELERPLREVVFGDGEVIHQTAYTQPALFALEVALYRLLESFGLMPDALIGHSVGEIAAAHVAGVFSLDDACRLVAARGRLMQALPVGGAMVAVEATEHEVLAQLDDRADVSVAAVNGLRSVVLSGDESGVLELAMHWEELGRKTRRLRVSHAFHSPAMDGMLAEFAEVVRELELAAPTVPLVSNLTGRQVGADEVCDPRYWVRHVREAVRFHDGVWALEAAGVKRFVELGPDGVLTALAEESLTAAPRVATTVLRKDRPEARTLLTALAELHVDGATVDWARVTGGGRRVDLPTYPFQHERYWPEAASVPAPSSVAAEADGRLWSAVAAGDVTAFADALGIDTDTQLSAVLPALASYRREQHELSAVDDWRYGIVWKPLPLAADGASHGNWVVVVPASHAEQALPAAVTAALRQSGATVTRLVVDPADLEPVRAAVTTATAGVLSLLALDELPLPEHPVVPIGLATTLALFRLLGQTGSTAPLWCVTSGAVSVDRNDPVRSPHQAMAWGLGRIIGLEHPERWGGLVDLPETFDDRDGVALTALLAAENGEDQAAVRAGGLHGRRMVRAGLTAAPARPWRPRGTVLVTGGTGGLGAQVARWLARAGAERLVLTSRRGAAAPGAAELIAELSALGCEAVVEACDMADRQAVAALLATWPPTAVVHAAGTAQFAVPVERNTIADLAELAGGKVAGAMHLSELLADTDLDAFVLFSSGAAVWGSGGQAAYGAANAFLDALAEQRRASGLVATSIAWGSWAGGGMAEGHVGDQLRRGGVPEMAPEPAVAGLRQAVDHEEATLVIADIDWERFVPGFTLARPRPLLDELPEVRRILRDAAAADRAPTAETSTPLAERLTAVPGPERSRVLLELVRTEAAAVLGHPGPAEVRPGRAFRELGFDSLSAVELRRRLATATGLGLPATLVFDYPTPEELAAHLGACLLPERADPEASALAELDRLAAALAGMGADAPAVDDRIGGRLRELLNAWEQIQRPESGSDADGRSFESATSDDELFDLIDSEFGL